MNKTHKTNKGDQSQLVSTNAKLPSKSIIYTITILNIHNYVQKIKKENRKEKRKELK